ncbi:hypothetical protein [Rhodanobacter sp. FW106-PBR-LB-2-11]|uniref:hypothetical protein n=1 Tax=Rhodanobacter sp. FW106-PBR-LB-2-11 TaxID=1524463 RepID=UPI0034E432D6
MRGAEYRVAGVGQARPGPQFGQVALEIQRGAAGQPRLQRVAAQRIAEAGLVQREEAAPVLALRQFQQERAAQVGGGDPIGVLAEIRLHAGAVDLPDVVLQGRGRQVRIQRIVAQAAGQAAPAVATLLRGGVGLLEGRALGVDGFGGLRQYARQQPAGDQQPDEQDAPRREGNGHGGSCGGSRAV